MSTILRELGARAETIDARVRAADFVSFQKALMAAGGDMQLALATASQMRTSAGAVTILKTAVTAGSTTTWSSLSDYRGAVGAFIATMGAYSVFDALLASSLQVPLKTRIAVTTSVVTAFRVGEASTKPISSLALQNKTLESYKAVGEVVLSQELVRFAGPAASALVGKELRRAVAVSTDAGFFGLILDGLSATPSSGSARSDIATALDLVSSGSDAKLFIITTSTIAKRLAVMPDGNGALAFPQATPSGGVVCGMPVLVSDGIPANSLVVVDASQLAMGDGGLEAKVAQHATIALNDSPDSPPVSTTNVTSLWQANLIATRTERIFGAQRLRDTAIAAISDINYSGNSPA